MLMARLYGRFPTGGLRRTGNACHVEGLREIRAPATAAHHRAGVPERRGRKRVGAERDAVVVFEHEERRVEVHLERVAD
jgi:hypothetical protein